MEDNLKINTDVSEDINDAHTTIDRRRWMQSIFQDIKHLKLHQLALPSAHNCGMDRDYLKALPTHWVACQDFNFASQLMQGARVLDLRIVDDSYKKDVGGSKIPRYKFIEIFKCYHGFVRGRDLSECVSSVRSFAEANRSEMVILDIHSFDQGRNLNNSVSRCRAKFNELNHLLTPSTAEALTLEQIRQTHPGRNVIICWSQGNGYWKNIPHKWTGKDLTSHSELLNYIKTVRNQLPKATFSSLSATVYEALGGPIRLKNGNAVWEEVFKPGQQVFNIINADFIQDTGIIDRCIALNQARGRQSRP